MASRSITDLHPTLAYAFGKAEAEWQHRYPDAPVPFLTATYRSNAEQDATYAIGRTKPGTRVTNAQAGQSPHNYNPSFAFDIAFQDKAKKLDYSTLLFQRFAALVALTPGITWGGTFKSLPDMPHFELINWRTLAKNRA